MTHWTSDTALGQRSEYAASYDKSLLQAIPRSLQRDTLGIVGEAPFKGVDHWHLYELSWLNPKGKPMVAMGRLTIQSDSPYLVESKSLKLYLNSFNQTRFEESEQVRMTIEQDLSELLHDPGLAVEFWTLSQAPKVFASCPGECLDDLDVAIEKYDYDPQILSCAAEETGHQVLHSHVLKSNCLVTGQPDWGTICIDMVGRLVDKSSLLRYLIGFRCHQEFHEHCVERVYMDLWRLVKPEKLTVRAYYTRRGGIDINPLRTNQSEIILGCDRLVRQ